MKRCIFFMAALALIGTVAVPGLLEAQPGGNVIMGCVRGSDGKPIQSATIRVLGTTRGGLSKPNGTYTIAGVSAGDHDMRVSAVGYNTVAIRICVSGDSLTTFNVTLAPRTAPLDKIVTYAWAFRTPGTAPVRSGQIKAFERTAREGIQHAIPLDPAVMGSDFICILPRHAATECPIRVDDRITPPAFEVVDSFRICSGWCAIPECPIRVDGIMVYPRFGVMDSVTVVSSGLAPEYGDVLCGCVNTQQCSHTDTTKTPLEPRPIEPQPAPPAAPQSQPMPMLE